MTCCGSSVCGAGRVRWKDARASREVRELFPGAVHPRYVQVRRRHHEVASDDLPDRVTVLGPEQAIEERVLRNWIWTALEALAEDERVTLVLRHFTRCRSYQAIAAVTGVPVGTVRSDFRNPPWAA